MVASSLSSFPKRVSCVCVQENTHGIQLPVARQSWFLAIVVFAHGTVSARD